MLKIDKLHNVCFVIFLTKIYDPMHGKDNSLETVTIIKSNTSQKKTYSRTGHILTEIMSTLNKVRPWKIFESKIEY